MQRFPLIVFPKLVPIKSPYHRWVNNMLTAAKQDPIIKEQVMSWRPGNSWSHIGEHPKIKADGHTGGTMAWTTAMVQNILRVGAKVQRHPRGFEYQINFLKE